MYESFYGFRENPFNLTPDPDYLFMSRGHEEAYTHLEYAIVENKGFVVISGEIGSGKTTLINLLLRKIEGDIHVAVINHTLVQPTQFIKMICQEFEIPVDGTDKAGLLDLFHDFLLRQFAERKRVSLIIDEAQNLPEKTLEEIRMLSNLESEKQHLIQIILVGQPELRHKLQKKRLEQFVQRVTVYCHLNGLDREETGQYIHHRLKVAGTERQDLFDEGAIEVIHQYSRGIPRLINILCDAALVYGFADELKVIDRGVVEEVVVVRKIGGIFHLDDEEVPASPPAADISREFLDQLDRRVQSLEGRTSLLESLSILINHRLSGLLSRKDERDEIVVDLLKMLKESLNDSTVRLSPLNEADPDSSS